jgi:hypothetical protein
VAVTISVFGNIIAVLVVLLFVSVDKIVELVGIELKLVLDISSVVGRTELVLVIFSDE